VTVHLMLPPGVSAVLETEATVKAGEATDQAPVKNEPSMRVRRKR